MEYTLTAEQIRHLDTSGYLSLLTSFPRQIERARQIMKGVRLEPAGGSLDQVVVAGVGGSAIGGDLLRNYLADGIPVPVLVNRDYSLPGFVGPATLIFVSSYSGNTEETLSACQEALEKGARIIAIASGGTLARLAGERGFPLIRIPGGMPPRAALGYSFVALLESLIQLGLASDQGEALDETCDLIRQKADEYGIDVDAGRNPAKQTAGRLYGCLPVIYAWGKRYEAVAARWRGQLAEVSKQLSSHHLLPEMNHNEIAGWQAPAELLRHAVIILLRDDQEPPRISRRMELTRESLAPRAGGDLEVWATGKTLLARMFSLIYLGDFTSYYLAALNRVDPTPIDSIEELKRQLLGDSG
jgi:glucose/mannose-6-phosphate isomerase